MGELIDTTQMYLRTIYELVEAGIDPRRARIVERLHQAGPTVSQTVARMERDGLLTLTNTRTIELTPDGFAESRDVMRRHRLAECLIMNTIGLGFPEAHLEACRWEHVVSERVAEKIAVLLGNPRFTPYGTPLPRPSEAKIPSLDKYGVPLSTAVGPGSLRAEFSLVDEHAQCDPEFLATMVVAGIKPGVDVTLSRKDEGFCLATDSGPDLSVPAGYGGSLRVRLPGEQE
ncbi:metal-dependent transcriptional regulator [Propionibacterium sp.]|uniref:metal-dependent transcriptional regulator n=1 Tax=Propionibacterium sp. TaxID=1977903 RepID=UPI0039ED367F